MEIFSIFDYGFMQRAFIIGILLAITLPCIGLTVVLKRLSMIGDTLAHSSLAGVAIGLSFGFDPILGSLVACIIAGLSIEFIRNRLKVFQEISTVIILGASIGIAGIFTSFLKNTNSISSYLFGSIITISDLEFYITIAISISVLLVYKIIYKKLYLIVFDKDNSKLLGINKKSVNFIFTFLCSIIISLSAKTIGSLIVSSLLVIPVISAMQYVKTYKASLFLSMFFSIVFIISGLLISFYFDLKPGSVIVLISVAFLLLSLAFKRNK